MGYKKVEVDFGEKGKVKLWLSWSDVEEMQRFGTSAAKEAEFARYTLWLALKHVDPDLVYTDVDEWIGELPGEYLRDKGDAMAAIVKDLTGLEREVTDENVKKSLGMTSKSSASGSGSKKAKSGNTPPPTQSS